MVKKIIALSLCLLTLTVMLCGCSADGIKELFGLNEEKYDPAMEMVADLLGKTEPTAERKAEDGFHYVGYSDGTACITGYSGNSEHLEIPHEIEGLKVVGLENKALFRNEKLISLTIPDSVEAIGNYACMYCKKLETVSFGKNLRFIGVSAFESECDDTKGKGGGSLKSISFNGAPESIGEQAFYCSDKLTEVVLPEGVKTIEPWAFAKCYGVKKIQLGEGLESIGDHAFMKCRGVESITIPGSCKVIGVSAFYQCRALTELSIGQGVEIFEKGVFEECESLRSVKIPASVKSVGKYSFYNCKALENAIFEGEPEKIFGDVFTGADKVCVHSTADSLIQYAKANKLECAPVA